ncbi:MAG TPA: bifunctional phosphoglucose/phosphomannose isomerase [bacterium]|nr:bifunctional phosphoglucose/phosphomannose isomerase [bacterium]
MMNLDNLKDIRKYDKKDMAYLLADFPDQCSRAIKIALQAPLPSYKRIDEILVCGMGGSGIGGEILKSVVEKELKIPLVINKDYQIPEFVNSQTLVFSVSYSGNTEETLSAYREAVKKKAQIVAITTGGRLAGLAKRSKIPVISIPSGLPPRVSLGYLFFSLLVILERLGLIKNKKKECQETLRLLKDLRKKLSLPSRAGSNQAKRIALKLYKNLPLIYTSPILFPAGLRWKGQLSENSKVLAFSNTFPELNHNEIVGWRCLPGILKRCYLINLCDKKDSSRIKKRIKITSKIIKDEAKGLDFLYSQGKSLLARLFSLIYLGDWVSYYLAILNRIDPTPVKVIDYLKRELARKG